MSKFFRLTKRMGNKRPVKASKKVKLNIQIFNLAILGLIIFAAVTYLVQVNALVTQGYQLKDFQSQISQLGEDSRNLELTSLRLQSMDDIKGKISQLNMVEAGRVDYLNPTPLVAVAR